MTEVAEKQWYIIHTYSGFEGKVKDALRRRADAMGMTDSIEDILVPTEEVVEIRDGKKKSKTRKFFPGYVLVKMQMSDDAWHVVRNTPKVTFSKSNTEVSENAPSMAVLKIDSDKIRDVIGKGGATIRSITEETGAQVDIDDDGTIRIYGSDAASRDAAVAKVEEITAEAEIGAIYEGKVARIVDFGAFVNILPGKDGLVHISQISTERVEKVSDYLEEGQMIKVKVLDVDQRGRIKLSMKELEAASETEES